MGVEEFVAADRLRLQESVSFCLLIYRFIHELHESTTACIFALASSESLLLNKSSSDSILFMAFSIKDRNLRNCFWYFLQGPQTSKCPLKASLSIKDSSPSDASDRIRDDS